MRQRRRRSSRGRHASTEDLSPSWCGGHGHNPPPAQSDVLTAFILVAVIPTTWRHRTDRHVSNGGARDADVRIEQTLARASSRWHLPHRLQLRAPRRRRPADTYSLVRRSPRTKPRQAQTALRAQCRSSFPRGSETTTTTLTEMIRNASWNAGQLYFAERPGVSIGTPS